MVQAQNEEELSALDNRRREEIIRSDKQVIDRFDAKVSGIPVSPPGLPGGLPCFLGDSCDLSSITVNI